MKRIWLGFAALILAVATGFAQAPEHWFHVRVVSSGAKGETVRVNVPISVAEQVLPAIHTNGLNDGKLKIHGNMRNVDLRALLDAVAKSPDNEFVTVQSNEQNIRVAKSGQYLLVKVRDLRAKADKSPQQVDVKVPISVAKALLSDTDSNDEINVLAGLEALKSFGDLDLVTVTNKDQSVRIWVDSRNTAD